MQRNNINFQFIPKEDLHFILNDHEKIIFEVNVKAIVHCCTHVKVFFQQYNHKFLIGNWEFQTCIEKFVQVIKGCLDKDFQLINLSEKEIGEGWNYVCKKKTTDDLYSVKTAQERFLYNPYLLFAGGSCASWLYNDDVGNIIFKVTPLFPQGRPRNKGAKYNTFLHWMKSYKPLVTHIIPVEIARRWLEQGYKVDSVIKNNKQLIFKL